MVDPMQQAKPRYMSITETAEFLGINYQTARKYAMNHTLPSIKLGRWRIDREALERQIREGGLRKHGKQRKPGAKWAK